MSRKLEAVGVEVGAGVGEAARASLVGLLDIETIVVVCF